MRTTLALLLSVLVAMPLQAQAPDVIYCRQPVFRIPFQIDANEQARLREVQLLVSDDQGKTWRAYATVGPSQRQFQFKAERDGFYSFAVRTQDQDGRFFPPALEGTKPSLRVIVDTALPVATLRALPPRQEQAGIEWDIRDDNLDLSSLQIEYRVPGGEWQPLAIEPQAFGTKYWLSPSRGPVDVRLRVRDKADNQTTAQALLGGQGPVRDPNTHSQPTVNPQVHTPSPQQLVPAGPNVKIVNSTRFSLNYGLEDVGPSGVSLVELWYTLDGRNWQRYGEDPDHKSPITMEVNDQGTYGLTLVVRSGVGLGDKPPQLNDPPQIWIEVDTTKPIVQLLKCEPGRGADSGNLTIAWTASDKNLAAQPISLFYAEKPEGPWHPMVTGLDNTGRYVWRIPPPPATPYRFLVRLDAIDRGGNIGRAETPAHVIVDLSQPKGRLMGVVNDR